MRRLRAWLASRALNLSPVRDLLDRAGDAIREARAASRLAHANVVQIFDIGVDGECTYFVMEYVDGCSLDHLIGTCLLYTSPSPRD